MGRESDELKGVHVPGHGGKNVFSLSCVMALRMMGDASNRWKGILVTLTG